jgi:hypothetical protein
VAEAVVTLVVGGSIRLLPRGVVSELQSLLEKEDLGGADRFIQFIEDFSGNGGIGRQRKAKMGSIQARPDNDGGGKGFVLLVGLLDISPAARDERVLTGSDIIEKKAAVIAGEDGLTGIGARLRLNRDLDPGERLATEGVNDDARNLKISRSRGVRRWSGRLLLLREGTQQEK